MAVTLEEGIAFVFVLAHMCKNFGTICPFSIMAERLIFWNVAAIFAE